MACSKPQRRTGGVVLTHEHEGGGRCRIIGYCEGSDSVDSSIITCTYVVPLHGQDGNMRLCRGWSFNARSALL
jgi:hypothetical protein